ncbi:hypothetical protein MITS9509_02770 [Synechococcus sp. MIT S9509]|nr:hypothetical protein MITS9504_02123 [Synechococcus sp. MIT S9504]KZR90481.1 hypothetical protein MITS9509_02770 [Synechococcus sp. MIT S9509]
MSPRHTPSSNRAGLVNVYVELLYFTCIKETDAGMKKFLFTF